MDYGKIEGPYGQATTWRCYNCGHEFGHVYDVDGAVLAASAGKCCNRPDIRFAPPPCPGVVDGAPCDSYIGHPGLCRARTWR